MFRKLLSWLRLRLVGDVYVVRDGESIVGVSGRWQGAELIRARHARVLAADVPRREQRDAVARAVYARTQIENHELQDGDDDA